MDLRGRGTSNAQEVFAANRLTVSSPDITRLSSSHGNEHFCTKRHPRLTTWTQKLWPGTGINPSLSVISQH